MVAATVVLSAASTLITLSLATQDVPAADYPVLRAEFAGSRWPDLRTAGTAYIDLADGYQTVWSYQRLSATCAKHGQPLNGSA